MQADLAGARFSRADLGRADLTDANLKQAHSFEAKFIGARLTRADLKIEPNFRQMSRGGRHGEEPGADIALQLARHGVHLNVDRVMSNGSPIPEVIISLAVQTGSDLLVVGAYPHSRLRELLLGGTSRTLLAQMPVPVFVSI